VSQATNGNNGKVYVWMAAGLREGEWYIDSKLRARRALTSKCFSAAPAHPHLPGPLHHGAAV
jgi:hypothetical protein